MIKRCYRCNIELGYTESVTLHTKCYEDLLAEIGRLKKEIDDDHATCAKFQEWKQKACKIFVEVEQSLCKVLHYPGLYPGASKVNGGTVCVGELTIEDIAEVAAKRIALLEAAFNVPKEPLNC